MPADARTRVVRNGRIAGVARIAAAMLGLGLAAISPGIATSAPATGDPEDTGAEPAPHRRRAAPPTAPGHEPAPRAALADQLDGQAASIERAMAVVGDKLSGAEAARVHRLAAAIRASRAAPGDPAVAVARRRAAARLLLARDRGERALLADEVTRLRAARDRLAGEVAQLPVITLPGEIVRPAPGKIARHFGTLEHERSKATLSRRGIDLEVGDHSPVVAPATGTVRYAGAIRGLDQGVILDHGDYLTVVAKLGEVSLPVGAPIAAGDRIGRAARHRVYLEVRVKLGPGGLPIDPEPLLATHPAAAQPR
jgi:murein DD-endopeptidase MepM/ murein hydrolase activator NlpD